MRPGQNTPYKKVKSNQDLKIPTITHDIITIHYIVPPVRKQIDSKIVKVASVTYTDNCCKHLRALNRQYFPHCESAGHTTSINI